MSDFVRWSYPNECPICQLLVETHAPGISYVEYQGQNYHPLCAEAAAREYGDWSDLIAMTEREARSLGEIMADMIQKSVDLRRAGECASRVKATLFLKEVLGPSALPIKTPRRCFK
jgi:hypothetical protein